MSRCASASDMPGGAVITWRVLTSLIRLPGASFCVVRQLGRPGLRLNMHHGLVVLSASHKRCTASHTAARLSAWEQWAHRRSHTAHNCRPLDAAAPLGSLWLAGALPRLTYLRPRHSAGQRLAPPNLGLGCWVPDGGRARLCPDAPQCGRDDAEVAGVGLGTRPPASPPQSA